MWFNHKMTLRSMTNTRTITMFTVRFFWIWFWFWWWWFWVMITIFTFTWIDICTFFACIRYHNFTIICSCITDKWHTCIISTFRVLFTLFSLTSYWFAIYCITIYYWWKLRSVSTFWTFANTAFSSKACFFWFFMFAWTWFLIFLWIESSIAIFIFIFIFITIFVIIFVTIFTIAFFFFLFFLNLGFKPLKMLFSIIFKSYNLLMRVMSL